MNVTCPNCATIYRVDPAKVPESGVRARCSVCSAVFAVRHEAPVRHDQSAPTRGRRGGPRPPAATARRRAEPPPAPPPPARFDAGATPRRRWHLRAPTAAPRRRRPPASPASVPPHRAPARPAAPSAPVSPPARHRLRLAGVAPPAMPAAAPTARASGSAGSRPIAGRAVGCSSAARRDRLAR